MTASDRPLRPASARPTEDRAPFVSPGTDLLAVIGCNGRITRVAPSFPKAFGYIDTELLDQPFISFIYPPDRVATNAALEELSRHEPTLELKNRFRCKDGSYRQLAWTAMPTPEGWVCAIARDIAVESRQPEEKRTRSGARQVAATVARKDEFLTSVCHDVQQPLTVIMVQTQVLQRQLARGETLPPEQLGTCLAYILAATNRVRGMTQDLLDASVQQSGHTLGPLLLARAELVALAREAVREHELVSKRHQFHFQADVPTLEAIVDEARLHRVLANLLTNATKYSPKGGAVDVSLTATDGPAPKCALLFVRDEGVGIPHDDLPHIFDRFHRGANAVGRFAGTGLGLASARELVELHGGSICVQSEEGKGSTFVVRLPLTPPARPDCQLRSADNALLGTRPNPYVALPIPNGP